MAKPFFKVLFIFDFFELSRLLRDRQHCLQFVAFCSLSFLADLEVTFENSPYKPPGASPTVHGPLAHQKPFNTSLSVIIIWKLSLSEVSRGVAGVVNIVVKQFSIEIHFKSLQNHFKAPQHFLKRAK